MTAAHPNTFLRFLLVGGAIAGIYAVLAALATSTLPIPRPVSSALIWVIWIPPAFWAQRRFTFSESRPHRHALGLYAATQVLSVGIVSGISHLFAQGRFGQDLVVHLVASAVAAVASYLINRQVIFPKSRPPAE